MSGLIWRFEKLQGEGVYRGDGFQTYCFGRSSNRPMPSGENHVSGRPLAEVAPTWGDRVFGFASLDLARSWFNDREPIASEGGGWLQNGVRLRAWNRRRCEALGEVYETPTQLLFLRAGLPFTTDPLDLFDRPEAIEEAARLTLAKRCRKVELAADLLLSSAAA